MITLQDLREEFGYVPTTAADILELAQKTHPGARYLTVFKFDPDNWPEIYERLNFRWPAYDEPMDNCPSALIGRGGVRVRQGEWVIYNRGPKRGEILGRIIVNEHDPRLLPEISADA